MGYYDQYANYESEKFDYNYLTIPHGVLMPLYIGSPDVPETYDFCSIQIIVDFDNDADRAIDGDITSYKRLGEVIVIGDNGRCYRRYLDDVGTDLGFYVPEPPDYYTFTRTKPLVTPILNSNKRGNDTLANARRFSPFLPQSNYKVNKAGALGKFTLPNTNVTVNYTGNTYGGELFSVGSEIGILPQINFSGAINPITNGIEGKITELTFECDIIDITQSNFTELTVNRTWISHPFSLLPSLYYLGIREMHVGAEYTALLYFYRLKNQLP